ncbi:TonB-dependent receptor [Kineobactrum salinum]|uniref:TonB-dependent receptor n=1 Tax=Kineobactrum salinum TaxID=2708301 RepID=A0A6C0U0I4_9GAMM|nr:TonB-dependent receptor [Kineobactrum salinum]QIB65622.1 TonB-dependent receptor [Kineobactrum salinum]
MQLRIAISTTLATLGVLGSFSAVAQKTNVLVLDEMLVTAQKRSESSQDIPVSVSAFSTDMLERLQIEDAAQLQFVVPGLVYTSSGGFATPYLRGIGSDIATVGAEPGVATYVDGVYVSSPLSVNMNFIGVERIEVVKGPQGTLYGRNAIGGAINIITKEPGQEFEGRVVAGYGNHDRAEVGFYVSGPVSDTLSLGIYGDYSQRDALVDNLSSLAPRGVPSRKEGRAVRAKAVLTPNETMKFVLTGEYMKMESPDPWGFRQVQDNALGLLAGGDTGTEVRDIYHNYPSFQEGRLYAATLNSHFDLPFAELVSITGYRDYEAVSSVDYDGTDASIMGFAINPATSEQVSQEIQLLSFPESTVKWIAGAYYFDEDTGGDFELAPGDALVNLIAEVPVTSYALFSEAAFPLTEKLEVTGGLRYTYEEKDVSSVQVVPSVNLVTVLPSQSESFEKVTWKLSASYHFNDDVMGYATYSRGFQSGAFNAVDSGAPPVDPEVLDALEVGLKSALLNQRVQLNLAGFYYDFQDLQVQVNDSATGAAASFQNAGAAEVFGFELSAKMLVTDQLDVDFSANYLTSEYQDFPNYAGFIRDDINGGNRPATVNVSGNEIVRAPEWTSSLSVNYSIPFGDSDSLEFSGSYYYNDGFAFDPQHVVNQDSYNFLNGSITWLSNNGYKVSLWGKNLTDEDYLNFGVVSNYGKTHADAPGRLFGVRLTYDFDAR